MEEKYILKYRIERELGRGGMSRVYLGVDPMTGLRVAIKVLNQDLAEDASMRDRFLVEAQSLAKLDHPDIVHLIEYDHEKLVLVQKYIEGMNLEEYITNHRGPIPEEEAKALFCKLLEAFAYVHSNNVIHRDIKPANILMTKAGQVKIVDFGIAKDTEAGRNTSTGTRMGTVAYMSPEQVLGEDLDKRTDIYSLGVLLHQMLTGKAPYDINTDKQFKVQAKIVQEPLPRMKSIYEYVSPGMQAVVDKATAKDRSKRYQSCEEFMRAIQTVKPAPLPGADWREMLRDIVRDKRVVAGVVVVMLVALGVFGFSHASKKVEPSGEPPAVVIDSSVIKIQQAVERRKAIEQEERLAKLQREKDSLTLILRNKPVSVSVPKPDIARHEVGEKYGGGIIFYVDASGQHGLIVAKYDINVSYVDEWDGKSYTGKYRWATNQYENKNEQDYAYQSVGGTGTAIGTGKQNTKRILVKYPGLRYPNSAAAVATAFQGGGYHDWFLPSIDELNEIYRQKKNIGDFSSNSCYWSSSEVTNFKALYKVFYGVDVGRVTGNKAFDCLVRLLWTFVIDTNSQIVFAADAYQPEKAYLMQVRPVRAF